MDELKFIRSLTPEDVFESWRKMEADIEHWKPFWEARPASAVGKSKAPCCGHSTPLNFEKWHFLMGERNY